VAPDGHTRSGVSRDQAFIVLIHRNLPGGNSATVAAGNKGRKEHLMLDVVMLALGLGFFAVAVGYAYACERL
jgi:hypothetical protein